MVENSVRNVAVHSRTIIPKFLCLCAAILLPALVPGITYAQVVTDIQPTTAPTDGSTNFSLGTTVNDLGTDVHEIGGGTLSTGGAGNNLFHSFQTFTVGAGDTARFINSHVGTIDGGDLTNIISRVRGGNVSQIFGAIDTATNFPAANFFLMNPAGVVFGASATLNVGGSVHVTTANSIVLKDGVVFDSNAQASVLTFESPESFGFLAPSSEIPKIEVQGASLRVATGETLGLIGGKLDVKGNPSHSVTLNPTLRAQGGTIHLTSVAGKGRVSVSTGKPDLGDPRGAVSLDKNVRIDARGVFGATSGGTVVISGGKLTVVDTIVSTIPAVFSPGKGGAITLDATGALEVKGGSAASKTQLIADSNIFSGGAGQVTLTASGSGSITMVDAVISAKLTTAGSGGTISISGPELSMDASQITAIGVSSTNPGTIGVTVGNLSLQNESVINSSAASSGTGGSITLTATGDISIVGQNSTVSSSASGGASGGKIDITTRSLILADGGRVDSQTIGTGSGGTVTAKASDSITISGADSGVFTNAAESASGPGGNISLSAGRDIEINKQGTVSARSLGADDAGNITLVAGNSILLRNSGKHPAVTTFSANADGGNITVIAPSTLRLIDSQISSSVGGGETTVGGNISIDPKFVILQNSDIRANAFEGKGGNIDIVTQVLLQDPNSFIDASSERGISGRVSIQSPLSSLSEALAPLPESIVEVSTLLRARCAARMQEIGAGSFVQLGRDAMPSQPGGMLASPQYFSPEHVNSSVKPKPHVESFSMRMAAERRSVWKEVRPGVGSDDATPSSCIKPTASG